MGSYSCSSIEGKIFPIESSGRILSRNSKMLLIITINSHSATCDLFVQFFWQAI